MKKIMFITFMLLSFNASALTGEEYDKYAGQCGAYAFMADNISLAKQALAKRVNIKRSQEYATTWTLDYINASNSKKVYIIAVAMNACRYLHLEP